MDVFASGDVFSVAGRCPAEMLLGLVHVSMAQRAFCSEKVLDLFFAWASIPGSWSEF